MRNLPSIGNTQQQSELFYNFASIAGSEAEDLKNFLFKIRKDGERDNIYIRKRDGDVALGDDKGSQPSLGGASYYNSSGSSKRFIAFDGSVNADIYELVGSTWTAASRSLTKNLPVFFDQFKDNLYAANGSNAVQKYNGSTWSSLAGGTPMSGAGNCATYCVVYNNMMIYAKSTNNPNRLWVSDANDPETVGASNYWDFHGAITGVIVLGTMLVVTTQQRIYVMMGSSPSSMVRYTKSESIGCMAFRSLREVNTPNGRELWFVANDNSVRAFNGETTRRVGYTTLEKTWESVNKGYLSNAAAGVYDGVYYLALSYGGSTYNNAVLTCDPRFEVWVLNTNWNAAFFRTYNSSGTITLWWGESNTDSVAYEYPSGATTHGTAIDFRYTTRNLDGGYPFLTKLFKKMRIRIKAIGDADFLTERNVDEKGWGSGQWGSDLAAYINLTGNNPLYGTAIYGTATYGTDTYIGLPENRGKIRGKGELAKYRFSDSNTVDQTEIYTMQHFFIPTRVR